MTRINLVDPAVLHTKHLIAELHELPRVFTLVKKVELSGRKHEIPSEYVLGTGHVIFFYDKLGFLAWRYAALNEEARRRGYVVNEIPREELIEGIPAWRLGNYAPTKAAVKLSEDRIAERTKPEWSSESRPKTLSDLADAFLAGVDITRALADL